MPKTPPPAKVVLTDRRIKSLKPAAPGNRAMHWDAALANFGVRVTDKGRKTFFVVRRLSGSSKLIFHRLGEYNETRANHLTLGEARAEARRVLSILETGKTPRQVEEEAEAERKHVAAELAERRGLLFEAVAEDYIELHVRRNLKTAKDRREIEARIRRELIDRWRGRPAREIRNRDVVWMVDEIIRAGGDERPGSRRVSGGPNAARHALSTARALFTWAVERDAYGLTGNPIVVKAKTAHGRAPRRKRILKDWELRAVWLAAGETPYPYGPLVRLLMLTGQRRSEIAAARWPEIDLDDGSDGPTLGEEARKMLGTIGAGALLTIPPERMKEEFGQTVPLTPAAVRLLLDLPRSKAGDYVFSTTGGELQFSGFSKAKARLDALAEGIAGRPMASWTHHDLRRTLRTALSAERIPQEIAEMVIAHKREGIEAVYDLHRFDHEKREALLAWERRLLGIVEVKRKSTE